MVQPVRLVAGWSAVLTVVTVAARASADPLPPSCRTGLVLGVADGDAGDVVAAVCNAAKQRNTPGAVRVSVVAAGPKVRVGIARLTDTTESERTAHAEAANIAEAIRIAPSVLGTLDAPPPPPPPLPSPPPSPSPTPVTTPEPLPEPERSPTHEQSALETKAGPPAAWVGVHGSSALVGGGVGLGGGAAIGVEHRSAQGFIDYSNSSASPSGEKISHHFLTIGARLKLSQRAIKPVIGGGWSYADYERGQGVGRIAGQGIGVFGETGVIWAIDKHQIMGLARLNLGLFQERTTRRYSSTAFDGQGLSTYETSSGGAIASSFTFLAGYGYVFR